MGHGIRLSEIAEKMDLKNLTPEVDMVEKVVIRTGREPSGAAAGRVLSTVLTQHRVQIIGNVEYTATFRR